jgi:hypothetical protein
VTILLLSPRETQDSLAVARTARACGWKVVRGTDGRAAPAGHEDSEVRLYGDPAFAELVARRLDLALLDLPADWLPRLPVECLRRRVWLTSLARARSEQRPMFIKAARGADIPSQVYRPDRGGAPVGTLTAELPVLVSEPVVWEVEFRCFVLEREVTTLSPYARLGRWYRWRRPPWPAPLAEVAEALEFTSQVLSHPAVIIPPAVVLDVGKIARRGWAVVEANPAWASALYGCDPGRVLPVLRRASRRRAQLTAEDLPWVP